MRIEDTVLIKENKQIEVLTQFSKKPLIIDH
jgi:Xaa-Pro aminopeptidase